MLANGYSDQLGCIHYSLRMSSNWIRSLGTACVTVLAAAGLAACGSEAPPIEATDHASGTQDEQVAVAVSGDDGVGVVFREIRIAPGASTGEHCHYGNLVAVVAEGELTHYGPVHPGGVQVYPAGESLIEGASYIHEGRNEGDEDVVLWVTYITPEGKPLAETDLTKCEF